MDTKHISVKVYHLENGVNKEIRKFTLDYDVAANFEYLMGKIKLVFSGLQRKDLSLCWKDEEGDFISISSDDELAGLINNSCGDLENLKLYIKVKNGDSVPMNNHHPGVKCDGCKDSINGIRYKCTVCPDFDLCSTCESTKKHPVSHDMLCMKVPSQTRGFGRRCGPGMRMRSAPFWCSPRYRCPKSKMNACPKDAAGKSEMGKEGMYGFIHQIASELGFDPEVAVSHAQSFMSQFHPPSESKCDTQNDKPSMSQQTNEESDQACKDSEPVCKGSEQECEINMEKLNDILMPLFKQCHNVKEFSTDCPQPCAEAGECSKDNADGDEINVNHAPDSEGKEEAKSVDKPTSSHDKKQSKDISFPFFPHGGIDSELPEEKMKNLSQVIGNVMQSIGSQFSAPSTADTKDGLPENVRPDGFVFVDEKTKKNDLTEEELYQVNLNEALSQMMAMGFDNEGDWLKQVLVAKNLDISKVLDALNPPKVGEN